MPNVCGPPPCTPTTCALQGKNCGLISDGCGALLGCGTCGSGQVCGLFTANVCGTPPPAPDAGCTGLQCQVAPCDGGTPTTLTGTVYAPNGTTALYNAVVYIPNSTVAPLTSGATCDQCGAAVSGNPVALTTTGVNGRFTLTNVPSGTNIPLVVQLGKWRRQGSVSNVPACATTTLTSSQTRLPRNQAEGNIPTMAVSTGAVDALECVLRKIGLDAAEFTNSTGTGRVHLYRSTGTFVLSGSNLGDSAATLLTDLDRMRTYDALFLGCDGKDYAHLRTSAQKANLRSYADQGGRLFATHFGWSSLYDNGSWANSAPWYIQGVCVRGGTPTTTTCSIDQNCIASGSPGDVCVRPWPTTMGTTTQRLLAAPIDTSFPKGLAFSQWLGTTTTSIADSRHDVDNVVSSNYGASAAWPSAYNSHRWIYSQATTATSNTNDMPRGTTQLFTFNTPWGAPAAQQCGRVVFSDFHVDGFSAVQATCSSNASCNVSDRCLAYDLNTNALGCTRSFANACTGTTLSVQEQMLAFMVFDAANCIGNDGAPPVPPPACTPTTCLAQGKNCGTIGDGCGGSLSCGPCTAPDVCGGGGVPNVCGSSCRRKSCGELGANCGTVGDGCGGTQECGACVSPASCGGGGVANVCGRPSCTPQSCADLNANCGVVGNGCGGTLDCGDCSGSDSCGGGGVPNRCGVGSCIARTCNDLGANCGVQGNGCGGTLQCGDCTEPQSCGGGGTPNQCGTPACAPRTCSAVLANCGPAGNGCGQVLDCGVCSAPQSCGGGGVPSQCGGNCTPTTCTQLGASCGLQGDACGGSLFCGVCPSGQVCTGTPSRCVSGTSCSPLSCANLGVSCGLHADGCGGLVDCGPCTSLCTPRTCADVAAQRSTVACRTASPPPSGCLCGPVADGCGGLLDCGACGAGQQCGGPAPSVCGSP